MSLIRLDNVTKSFGGDLVLTGVDLRLEENDRIGLIGRNGTGKSTIFRLIMGETEPDQGLIERMRRRRCACLRQLPHFDAKDTIYSMVLRAFKELISMEAELEDLGHRLADDEGLMDTYSVLQERFTVLGGYEYRANIARVLTGLGFAENEFELPVSALSGGQRTRLMLAIVLLEDADLLLLDEPETHLDLAARDWLESFLKDWPRAFIIISHDRAMLNAVVNRVVELENGALSGYTGNYDAFIEQKALVREQMQKTF
ncbi:MAG: ATP-binding cassette domain-containing protein, partial [Candidatus Hydrogenedentes bacterium]|nr:ATP-binding cassette domain-containing protein [Candidatus Hydrogenedentota bacterium]